MRQPITYKVYPLIASFYLRASIPDSELATANFRFLNH